MDRIKSDKADARFSQFVVDNLESHITNCDAVIEDALKRRDIYAYTLTQKVKEAFDSQ